jgi:hypothetical protein
MVSLFNSVDKREWLEMHTLIGLLAHWLTHSLAHLLTGLLTHSRIYLLIHWLTHSLTHLLTHSLTYWLTHSLTHSWTGQKGWASTTTKWIEVSHLMWTRTACMEAISVLLTHLFSRRIFYKLHQYRSVIWKVSHSLTYLLTHLLTYLLTNKHTR